MSPRKEPERRSEPAAAKRPADPLEIVSLGAAMDVDGQFVDGFIARPIDGVPRPGLIMLSNMRGLTPNQRELTRRYARAGFVALTVDVLHGQLAVSKIDAGRQ